MDLNDVKKQIHSLLLKNKGVMLCDIDALFTSIAGHNIPYDKFGFKTLLAFLQTLTDILKIANYDGILWIEPLSNVNSLNASKNISKKKPTRINTSNSISHKRHMSKLTNDSNWLNNGKASHIASSYLPQLNATYSQNDTKSSSKPVLDIFHNTSLDNKHSSFNTRSLNYQSQSLHKPKTIPSKMKKNASTSSNFHSRKLLENFLLQNEIGKPIFTFLGPPQEKTYQAKLSINGREWNSFDCDSKELAEEECSAKALKSLNELIKDSRCITNVSESDLIFRLVEILKEDPFHSLSKNGIEEAYKKKYKASIFPNWIEIAKKFQNLLKIEEIVSSNKTLITVSLPIVSPIVSSPLIPVSPTPSFDELLQSINNDAEKTSYNFATIDNPGFKDVIIGEIFGVSDVIIRLFNSYDEYVDLIEKMIARYMNLPNKAKVIEVGKVYAAVFEETVDRVIILKKIDDNNYLCKNVDDGAIESVQSSCIHYLDPENLKLPFQAISSQLEGLELFSDNIVATEYLQQRVFKVENAFSIASVKSIEKPLKIVLFDVSEKSRININEEILQYLRRHAFDDIIRCTKTEVKGFLVEAFENGQITIQLKNKYLDLLIEKQMEINNLCNNESSICDMIEFGLSVGTDQIFYGLYGNDWYRITIDGIINDQIVSVRYVDYGSFNFLKQLQIRKLDSSIDPLYSLPFLGIDCMLDNVPKDDCFEFTSNAASALYEMVNNLPIKIKIVEPANDQKSCSVIIFKEELGKLIDVNEQLCLKNDLFKLKIAKDIDTLVLNEVDDGEYIKNDDPSDEIVGSSEPIPVPILPEDKDNLFAVRIIHPVNQHNFFVHILNDVMIEKYKMLLNDIQEFYENDENKFDLDPKLFKKGKFYAVKIENSWMRAKLIDQRSGELALYLVDIGDIKLASPSNVQALYSRFRSLPMMAIKATLPKTIQWNDCDSLFFSRIVKDKNFTAKLNSIITTEDGPVLELSLIYNGKDIQQLVVGGHELSDL